MSSVRQIKRYTVRAALLLLLLAFMLNNDLFRPSCQIDYSKPVPVQDEAQKSIKHTAQSPDKEGSIQELSILEIHRNIENIVGQRVSTKGMLKIDAPDTPDGAYVLFRFIMVCCANDMQPLAVLIKGELPEKFENESWVSVTGVTNTFYIGTHLAIEINADSIIPTDKPEVEFLFPIF